MSFIILGISHKTANIEYREQLVINKLDRGLILRKLLQSGIARGAILLTTCNRIEFIITGDNPRDLLLWFAQLKSIAVADLEPLLYFHYDTTAINHLMSVASGLESAVLGETQILGQLKKAYYFSEQNEFIDRDLMQIMPQVFTAAKHVRTNTAIGEKSVSLSSIMLKLASTVFNLAGKKVLFIGAGSIITHVITSFAEQVTMNLCITNRSLEKSTLLATKYDLTVIPLSALSHNISDFDIIISGISVDLPIISKSMLESALKKNKNKTMLLIDLGVPRNIDPEISKLSQIYLYNIDNLHDIINRNLSGREMAAAAAREIIAVAAERCFKNLQALDAIALVRDFRQRVGQSRDMVLNQAMADIKSDKDPEKVLVESLNLLTNKILHTPTVKMRRAVAERREDILNLMKEFFEL